MITLLNSIVRDFNRANRLTLPHPYYDNPHMNIHLSTHHARICRCAKLRTVWLRARGGLES